MTARLMDGKAIAQALRNEIKAKVDGLVAAGKRVPGLAVVIVGQDPASQIYVRNKHKKATEAGMVSRGVELPASASQVEVEEAVAALAADPSVHGILAARIDRLPEREKALLHTAAAIGLRFAEALLRRVCDLASDDFDGAEIGRAHV